RHDGRASGRRPCGAERADRAGPPRPARGRRRGGAVPGRPGSGLHHGAGAGGGRRDGHLVGSRRSRGCADADTLLSRSRAMADIEAKVKDIIINELGVEAEKVTNEASFVDDLGADSLDTVELVMAFEEEFGIEIPDEDAEKLQTVGDAIEYIRQNQS